MPPASPLRVGYAPPPGGTLLVIAAVRGEEEDPAEGPWPLTRAEVGSFAADGLELVRLEDFRDPDVHRRRAELRRTGPAGRRSGGRATTPAALNAPLNNLRTRPGG
jgi:hypothetical protein